MAQIAFIGLGVMGYPMAGHLAAQGHQVRVYNRTQGKAEAWVKDYAGDLAATPCLAAKDVDMVITCVGNDEDLRSVCLGDDGAFKGMKPGAILVDHTTVSAKVSRELATIAATKHIGYVDAPVSGGQIGAKNGQLSIMCGGSEQDFIQVEPIITAYGKIIKRLGEVGAGQSAKMCNQVAIAGILQGLSEALNLAEKSGLDAEALVEVISQGAAGSWQMVNRHKTMLAGDYNHGFAVDWMRKDLAICLEAANEVNASLPITALVDQFFKEIQSMGGGRWDTSSLFMRLKAFD